MRKKYIYLIISILITIFIFSNSMQSADDSSQTSGALLAMLAKLLEPLDIRLTHNLIRKTAHFSEFFAQGIFVSLFFEHTRRRLGGSLVNVAFWGLFTACLDERLQLFYIGRSAQVSDIFIDFSGTIVSIIIVSAAIFLFRGHNRCRR